MKDIDRSEFLEKLKTTVTIKCYYPNALAGDLLYHILAIYDDVEVAVKYFGRHKQWWHFTFYSVEVLFQFFQNGWIELRGEK